MEVQAVKAAFGDAGIDATVEAGLETRSVELAPWVISAAVPGIAVFLKLFLGAAVKSAGEAAGREGVKRLVGALYKARRPARGGAAR